MWAKTVKHIVWSLASIIVFLAILETGLHLTSTNPHPRGYDFTVNRAWDFPEVFLKDKDLFWRFRSGQTITSEFFEGKTYRINRQGFRGEDFHPVKNGFRIAVLGNSCSFGWGVTEEGSFAGRLHTLMVRAGIPQTEVYNFSVPGYTSFQGARNFSRYVEPYKPDILLVTFAWNDQWLAANNRPDKEIKMPPRVIISLQNLLDRFRFYRVFKQGIFSILPSPNWDTNRNILSRVELDDFKANLAEIIRAARQDSTRVVLMTSPIPSMERYYGISKQSVMHELHRYYNDAIRETAASFTTGLVDLAAIFDRRSDLFDNVKQDPFHYNIRGHVLAAQEIFRFLDDQGYLPSPLKPALPDGK
ncbi:MAG: SGNH/GDSL hydrolase family protein [candidate division Zixibacteria bacterium]|nr:SGNH/GDSL hydrolase family protein [candidate division Zixibacteria bacterium]